MLFYQLFLRKWLMFSPCNNSNTPFLDSSIRFRYNNILIHQTHHHCYNFLPKHRYRLAPDSVANQMLMLLFDRIWNSLQKITRCIMFLSFLYDQFFVHSICSIMLPLNDFFLLLSLNHTLFCLIFEPTVRRHAKNSFFIEILRVRFLFYLC